jgi:hypothetical protein
MFSLQIVAIGAAGLLVLLFIKKAALEREEKESHR